MSRICFFILIVVIGCGVSASSSTVLAAPILWPVHAGGNGHYYEFRGGQSSQFVTWPQARLLAENSQFRGVQGHLATITSQAEWEFLVSIFPVDDVSPNGGFLGGYQDLLAADYVEPIGGWRWVTGEPWEFTAWDGGEPSDFSGRENYLEHVPVWQGRWNDEGQDRRFYVEYPVPEPSTYSLATIGLIGMAGVVRQRKRH
jgi:hypothetical protein